MTIKNICVCAEKSHLFQEQIKRTKCVCVCLGQCFGSGAGGDRPHYGGRVDAIWSHADDHNGSDAGAETRITSPHTGYNTHTHLDIQICIKSDELSTVSAFICF